MIRLLQWFVGKSVKYQSLENNLIMKYSRNSVALQTGCYVTFEEKQRRKNEILKHKFI